MKERPVPSTKFAFVSIIGRAYATPGTLLDPVHHAFRKTRVRARNLERGPAGHAVNGFLEGPQHAFVHDIDGDHGGNTKADAENGDDQSWLFGVVHA